MNKKGNYVFYITILLVCSGISLSELIKKSDSFSLNAIRTDFSDMNESEKYDDPVNLGVDYSDDEAPSTLRDALTNIVNNQPLLNQYSPNIGLPRFLKAIASLYSKVLNLTLDPNENVLATVGATEALHVAFLGLTDPGDEWIVIEPCYTRYVPMIKMARGVPRFTTLKKENLFDTDSSDYKLNRTELESLFNDKTKGIIINNPNNPTGKSFTLNELQFIADLAKKWSVLVISDEAHEWITYEPVKHIRIVSLPGMFERTVSIGSASKTFSVTGWRIGWLYGSVNILNPLKVIHSNTVHSAPTPQQEAIAIALEQELQNFGNTDSYFASNVRSETLKRNRMSFSFLDVGILPVVPDAGYCMVVYWRALDNGKINYKNEQGTDDGMKFNYWMIKNIGVLGVPMSVFYSEDHRLLGEDYIRYCFHKKDETLQEAVKRFKKLKSYRHTSINSG